VADDRLDEVGDDEVVLGHAGTGSASGSRAGSVAGSGVRSGLGSGERSGDGVSCGIGDVAGSTMMRSRSSPMSMAEA
jgi:hypothetical protein